MTDKNLLTTAAVPAPEVEDEPSAPPSDPPDAAAPFRDPETGELQVDALLASYQELERKLSAMVPAPAPDMAAEDRQSLLQALGRPETPEAYEVTCGHGLFEPDPEVNKALHAAGLTGDQVQAVYDLAADRMMPMVRDIAADFEAEREVERLIDHFGGGETWAETARQLHAWGRRHLPPAALEGLSASFEGVVALHSMMQSGEPATLASAEAEPGLSETDLHALMRDPRYWRERDPATVAKVTEGFQRLYPGRGRQG